MPHSGGGGSSSSGSHHSSSSSSSSSHHSGGGGSSYSGARYSQRPRSYHTAYRSHDDDVYVCYQNGAPQFRYVGKEEYRRSSKIFIILTSLFPVVLFSLLAGVLLHAMTYTQKMPPVTEPYASATWTMIDDRANSFTPAEEQQISEALRGLYQTSGIRTEIQTITEDMFLDANKFDLEAYAYSEYVKLFSDEDHFLIVFEDMGKNNYAFELMEGDNTSGWLTSGVSDHFDNTLTENLLDSYRYTYGTAFAASLQDLNQYMTKHAEEQLDTQRAGTALAAVFIITAVANGIMMAVFLRSRLQSQKSNTFNISSFVLIILCIFLSFRPLFLPLFWLVLGVAHMSSLLSDGSAEQQMEEAGYQKLNHPVMVKDSSDEVVPKMVKCDYCDGVYPLGMMSCPHCGAPAKASVNE